MNQYFLTLMHSERPKLHRVLAILSAIGLNMSELQKVWMVGSVYEIRENIDNFPYSSTEKL